MTKEEIIEGLEIYTVGRPNKARVHITVEELQKFIDAIKTLEQTRWIPSSEESPKKRDGYYVTLEGTGELEGVTETTIATWIGGWLYCHVDDWELKKVSAWMPLPKSYKAKSEEREDL